jgi:hypothetical protein
MPKKAGQYVLHCLDAIIERICCISGLCLLIGRRWVLSFFPNNSTALPRRATRHRCHRPAMPRLLLALRQRQTFPVRRHAASPLQFVHCLFSCNLISHLLTDIFWLSRAFKISIRSAWFSILLFDLRQICPFQSTALYAIKNLIHSRF